MAKKSPVVGRKSLEPKSSQGSIESFFKRSHKVIVALTVQEILDEHIAKKLV
jgi:hypothetical protein